MSDLRNNFSLDRIEENPVPEGSRVKEDFDEVVELVPETVEEFEDKYGSAHELVADLERAMRGTSVMSNHPLRDGLLRSAVALEVVSRGGDPETVQELYDELDEAGLVYEDRVKIGEQVRQPVDVLGGEDWTRLTYQFDDWMSLDDERVNMHPTIYSCPTHDPAIESSLSVDSIGELPPSMQLMALETIAEENLSEAEYFNVNVREDEVGDNRGPYHVGGMKIPSPYDHELGNNPDYNHKDALETVRSYGDSVRAIQRIGERREELEEQLRRDIQDIARSI